MMVCGAVQKEFIIFAGLFDVLLYESQWFPGFIVRIYRCRPAAGNENGRPV
jgi:hypothetical protein